MMGWLAIAGLPENCYDPHWLSSLKENERKLVKLKLLLDKKSNCAFFCIPFSGLMHIQLSFQPGCTIHPTCKG
jgi:hypothetical protein